MISALKNKLFVLSVALLLAPLFVTTTVSAASLPFSVDINNSLCTGTNIKITTDPNSKSCANTTNGANKKANGLVKTIINIMSAVVGILAVIMIIVAGFRYVTSGGSDEAVKGAKNTIVYVIIGLVIVALAQLIVHFVLDKAAQAS